MRVRVRVCVRVSTYAASAHERIRYKHLYCTLFSTESGDRGRESTRAQCSGSSAALGSRSCCCCRRSSSPTSCTRSRRIRRSTWRISSSLASRCSTWRSPASFCSTTGTHSSRWRSRIARRAPRRRAIVSRSRRARSDGVSSACCLATFSLTRHSTCSSPCSSRSPSIISSD